MKTNDWIPVTKQLPEPYKLVEVRVKNGIPNKDMLIKGKYGNLEWRNWDDSKVKAWRELPE